MRFSLRLLICAWSVLAIVCALLAQSYHSRKSAFDILERNDARIVLSDGTYWSQLEQTLIPLELTATVKRVRIEGVEVDSDLLWALHELDEVKEVAIVESTVSPTTGRKLAALPNLKSVAFFAANIESGAISEISKSKHLESICLEFSNATDEDCEQLVKCRSLKRVLIGGTPVTDKGLLALAELPELSQLFISKGPITQNGVEVFLSQHRLDALYCFGDSFEDDWWAGIQKRHPNCKIHR